MGQEKYVGALPAGTNIGGYRVVSVLGDGGFGVTYKAENVLEELEEQVAIKEYMPIQFAVRNGIEVHPRNEDSREDFEWGREQFLNEARMLASFKHPNIVKVKQFFRDNNTAYIVMEYEDGEPLNGLLDRHGALTEAQLKRILVPIADGLCEVHRQGVWHRDIKPANIFVRRSDESPVLLDFGAARNALGVKSKSMEAIVSPPYSPPEQYYSKGKLGSYTDIYALSALCYRAITGVPPEESPQRVFGGHRGHEDPLRTLAEEPPEGYSTAMLAAVDWGLRLNEEERPQSVEDWLGAMEEPASVQSPADDFAVSTNDEAGKKPEDQAIGLEPEPQRDAELHAVAPDPRPHLRRGASRRRAWTAAAVATPLLGIAMLTLFLLAWGQDAKDPPDAPVNVAVNAREVVTPLVGSFLVANRAAQKIVVVRAAPVAMDNYGDNKLGTATILPGREQRVLLDEYEYGDACDFDVLIRTEDKRTHEGKKDLCSSNEIVFGGDSVEGDPPGSEASKASGIGMRAKPVVVPPPPPAIDCVTCQTFTVRTGPPGARVQITNIEPRYEPQIKLPVGSYDVRVTADGFETVDRTLRHSDEPTDIWVGLPFQDCPVCPKMVELPTGSYTMGTSRGQDRYANEGPAHHVEIQYPFAVGVFEVSFEEWNACAKDGGCARHVLGGDVERRPVVQVTAADAKEYVDWLEITTGRPYRLLSEAEWEYAARAGTSFERHWGNKREDQCIHENGADVTAQREHNAWTIVNCVDGYIYAAPNDETRFRANPWGLHHMLGNVSEWTADCWHQNYVRAPNDGSAWTQGCDEERRKARRPIHQVVRGGSWASKPRWVRAPMRLSHDPAEPSPDIGFRVAVGIVR